MEIQNDLIESAFRDLVDIKLEKKETIQHEVLTLWVPKEHKEKYDLLQQSTNRKFGKLLKELLKTSIDKCYGKIEHV